MRASPHFPEPVPGWWWRNSAFIHPHHTMPTRLCLQAGCPNPSTYRGRCATHARTTNQATHRNRTIYNSARWKHTREAVLHDQPLCRCGQIATDVDHITAIEAGGNPWARANLQALCQSCHGAKTRQEQTHG